MKDLRSLGARRDDPSERASADFAALAARKGLIDVSYVTLPSPFGTLLVATTDRGLVRLAYPDEHPDAVLQELSDRISPRVLESPLRTDEVRRELEDYFEQRRRGFDLNVDLSLVGGFAKRVLQATSRIPYGAVSTYREVAATAGSPRGFRAAGNALGSNPVPIVVPCHRVLRSGGGLGGYTGGLDRKEFLLRLEGVPVVHPGARGTGSAQGG